MTKLEDLFKFFLELDKLKSVYRETYLSDLSRKENSAEHSWHLAMAVLTLNDELDLHIDISRAVKMALVHDIGEIGAGDTSVYHPHRSDKVEKERLYLQGLQSMSLDIVPEITELWEEYETGCSLESRWVKVADRLLPFMMNLATDGKAWINQQVKASQVREVHLPISEQAPEIYQWMLQKIDHAVERGWLIDT